MSTKWIEKLVGPLDQKRRYRQYKARTRQLPAKYRTAIEALERYLMHAGLGGDGDNVVSMFEDLLDLFEQSVAEHTPIREIVGQDPVEFLESFVRNYPDGQWRIRERTRLINAIDGVAGGEQS
ncbi:MAG: DUF1048 domain-containing protein [Acidimicrobiales bacterium]